MMDQQAPARIDLETARRIVDFSGGQAALRELADNQLQGAVALYNNINDPECKLGYLADEVGMGKTYVALGVVAFMRYFNPGLRVLYICPSRNVQDKWQREYLSFIRYNVKTTQFRIRTPDGKPAAPYINCNGLSSLLAAVTTGHFADIFVRKDSFSLGMSEEELDDNGTNPYLKDLENLQQWVPALRAAENVTTNRSQHDESITSHELKNQAKEFHAQVLNRSLPDFDLIVVDEAHNFKHHFDNSYRNQVLSWILGTHTDPRQTGTQKQVQLKQHLDKVLLLSATPYDRNIDQLKNQLSMFGRQELMDTITDDKDDALVPTLSRFMVRRLNTIPLNGEPHTRNQYRVEHRSGPRAEIEMQSDEQKLVTALVQKKVGEVIGRHRSTRSFQVGLLSSFESYADSAGERVQFDGEPEEQDGSDAEDRHLLQQLNDSWRDHKLGVSLPHPKMDTVSQNLAEQMLRRNRKQLVFVRRVKSVGELKSKLDEAYDHWLRNYLQQTTNNHQEAKADIRQLLDAYAEVRKPFQRNLDDQQSNYDDVNDNRPPPKSDNLFTWFFRGANPTELTTLRITPENIAKGLAAPNQMVGTLLEFNWSRLLRHVIASDADWRTNPKALQAVTRHTRFRRNGRSGRAMGEHDYVEQFLCVQLAFLHYLIEEHGKAKLKPLFDLTLQAGRMEWLDNAEPLTSEVTLQWLENRTLFDIWQEAELLPDLFSSLDSTVSAAIDGDTNTQIDEITVRRLEAHRQLIISQLRNGHGLIDVYLARLLIGQNDLKGERRTFWLDTFTDLLKQQRAHANSGESGFCTWSELSRLSSELDAIIKANAPGVLQERAPQEFRRYLGNTLTPLAPVIGASGETGSGMQRSNQARKFRMPGYPLALISTDVFQEGEDLHLFCDSVTHYGLAASPVSIEQKTGRVDRVGALSHRNLAEFNNSSPPDNSKIQVSFPHVRESIEYLQVRQTCHNINAFIQSLDKAFNPADESESDVHVQQQMMDPSKIPPQISRRLKPHYEPESLEDSSLTHLHDRVAQADNEARAKVRHVEQLLSQLLKVEWHASGHRGVGQLDDGPELIVELSSARGSGHLLLSLTENHAIQESLPEKREDLIACIQRHGWHDWCRPILLDADKRANRPIVRNVEMMVDHADITTEHDVRYLARRFTDTHDPNREYQPPSDEKLINLLREYAKNNPLSERHNGLKTILVEQSPHRLNISIDQDTAKAEVSVDVYQAGERCVLLSRVADKTLLDSLDTERLLDMTLTANRHHDIIEFLIDDDHNLVVRAVHPILSVTLEELAFCVEAVFAVSLMMQMRCYSLSGPNTIIFKQEQSNGQNHPF